MRRAALAVLVFLPSTAWAEWPQSRHDAAHSGYTDELVEPPLMLRWTQEWQKRPEARATVGGCRNALYASDDSLILNTLDTGRARLLAETGEVVWQSGPGSSAWLVAIDGDALVEAFWWPVESEIRRNGFSVFDAATGELRFRLTSDDELEQPQIGNAATLPEDRTGNRETFAVSGGVICVPEMLRFPNTRIDEPWLRMYSVVDGARVGATRCMGGVPIAMHTAGTQIFSSPYRHPFRIRAWSDQLMVLTYYESEAYPLRASTYEQVVRRCDFEEGPWAISGDAAIGMTPEEFMVNPWLFGDHPHVSIVPDAGLALGYEAGEKVTHLSCREGHTGELVWRLPLLAPPRRWVPASDGRAAYLGLADGYVYAIDLRNGEGLWRTKVSAPAGKRSIHEKRFAGGVHQFTKQAPLCSVSEGIVWVTGWVTGTGGYLAALNAEDGELLWEAEKGVFGPSEEDEDTLVWVKQGTLGSLYEPVIHGGWVYLLTEGFVNRIEAWGPPDPDAEEEADEAEVDTGADEKPDPD